MLDLNTTTLPAPWRRLWLPLLRVTCAVLLLGLAGAAWRALGSLSKNSPAFASFRVERTDLPIAITEVGRLESQLTTELRSEVEDLPGDGIEGHPVVYLVPDGSYVKAGDLLVEMNSATIRDHLHDRELECVRAKSGRIQAEAKYEGQHTANATLEAEAELQLELAELELDMYLDQKNGTHQLAKEAIGRMIDEARNGIIEAERMLDLTKTEKEGVEALFRLGHRGKAHLDQTKYSYLKAKDQLTSSLNRLRNREAELRKLDTFEFRKQKLTLEGAVATAARSLKQVLIDNDSLLIQATAVKLEAEARERKALERQSRLQAQLDHCQVYAPHAGMAIHARDYDGDVDVAQGRWVRKRERLITLPDLSRMQVRTRIHEAMRSEVRKGLRARVRVVGFPDRIYTGVVHDVAQIPASRRSVWRTTTYDCTIRILENTERLRPGMTAVVEIQVDRVQDAFSVPVQTVVTSQATAHCYVLDPDGIERRDVVLGPGNDKFVQVIDGLSAGERIVLHPEAVFAETGADETRRISPEAGRNGPR